MVPPVVSFPVHAASPKVHAYGPLSAPTIMKTILRSQRGRNQSASESMRQDRTVIHHFREYGMFFGIGRKKIWIEIWNLECEIVNAGIGF